MAPVLRRMYPNSHAGVLGAGQDLGWREFSLVLCQLLRERESPEHLTGHQQRSRASPLAIGRENLKPAPTRDHADQDLIAGRIFAPWSRRCKPPSRSSDITSPSGSARRPAGEISRYKYRPLYVLGRSPVRCPKSGLEILDAPPLSAAVVDTLSYSARLLSRVTMAGSR